MPVKARSVFSTRTGRSAVISFIGVVVLYGAPYLGNIASRHVKDESLKADIADIVDLIAKIGGSSSVLGLFGVINGRATSDSKNPVYSPGWIAGLNKDEAESQAAETNKQEVIAARDKFLTQTVNGYLNPRNPQDWDTVRLAERDQGANDLMPHGDVASSLDGCQPSKSVTPDQLKQKFSTPDPLFDSTAPSSGQPLVSSEKTNIPTTDTLITPQPERRVFSNPQQALRVIPRKPFAVDTLNPIRKKP